MKYVVNYQLDNGVFNMDLMKQRALNEAVSLQMSYTKYKKIFNIFPTVCKKTYEKHLRLTRNYYEL